MANGKLPRVVLDTDTFNEVDDQFALAHLLLSPTQLHLEAVYAAPFFNSRSSSAGEGMELSYQEIQRVYSFFEGTGTSLPPALRGSDRFMAGPDQPVKSAAAEDLIQRAKSAAQDGERLQVLAIGACTNVSSALLIAPEIAGLIDVVWLGGHGLDWPDTKEFNLAGDLHASRLLMEARAPLVLLPCFPVVSHLSTTVAELENHLAPYSKLGAYLTEIVRAYGKGRPVWSKVIWDIAASAWIVNPAWVRTREVPSPVLREDVTWGTAPGRPTIRMAWSIDRDAILGDFFAKAREMDKPGSV